MAEWKQPGEVLPRPRIPNVVGFLNIVFATALMLLSLTVGFYILVMPMTNRAMIEMQKKAQADLEAKRQADLKTLDQTEKSALTAAEKQKLAQQRKALAGPTKVALPITMDMEKLGLARKGYFQYYAVETTTAVVLDILMLAAGVGLVKRRMWGIRLGIGTAAAKLVRLVLINGCFILLIVPPLAQASGRVGFEMVMRAQGGGGGGFPKGMDLAFFTRMYYITYTIIPVFWIVTGSIYPAISIWLLTRPGARAACEERAAHFQALSATRSLGLLNIVFASCLILFGLCLGAYISVLPVLGRTLNEVQKKTEAQFAKQQKADLERIAEAEKKATTESEKEELAEEREMIESKPKPQVTGGVDLMQLGFNDRRIQLFYWVELASGLLLNVLMIAVGIGLLRRRSWGMVLGIGTAGAKILRLVLVYGVFAAVLAPVMAQRYSVMVGKMMVQQQTLLGRAPTPVPAAELDATPLARVYSKMYVMMAIALMVAGSIYPAASLWVLTRARADARRAPPALAQDEVQ
jgi:hypothetical protein